MNNNFDHLVVLKTIHIFLDYVELKGRLDKLKKGHFSATKLSDLLHTGPKLKLKRACFQR